MCPCCHYTLVYGLEISSVRQCWWSVQGLISHVHNVNDSNVKEILIFVTPTGVKAIRDSTWVLFSATEDHKILGIEPGTSMTAHGAISLA